MIERRPAHLFGPVTLQMLLWKMLEFPAMKRRTMLQSLPGITLLPSAAWAASGLKADSASTNVYELRVYHTYEGKLNDLLKRFREHTTKLFEKHGIKNVAYWTPLDEPAKSSTLIYILEHPSREAAAANWKAFQDDPEWKSVRDKSEENGKIVEKVDSTYMALTDFSPRLR
jgi:NIPSNAP